MITALTVGLAGFLGTILRYLCTHVISSRSAPDKLETFNKTAIFYSFEHFPWATLLVNILGSYLIAVFSLKLELSPRQQLLFTTGLLGGFTTYSSFSLEAVQLFLDGKTLASIFYIFSSVVGGLGAVFLVASALE